MDMVARNYVVDANVADASCEYHVRGCMYPAAANYDPEAAFDDGSCLCGDGHAPVLIQGGGLGCPVRGCTNPAAGNYNPQAALDDGSCVSEEAAALMAR